MLYLCYTEDMVTSTNTPNRILLYVHYNKYGVVADHVLYQLEKLRPLYNRVVFISNSQLPADADNVLGDRVDKIMQRENVGFDFAAWRDAMLDEGFESLAKYDWLTIMNDTCFGPVYPLEPIYEKMESSGADFWGMTEHIKCEIKAVITTDGIMNYHIPSYFISFRNNAVVSNAFIDFWSHVKDYTDVNLVIRDYETWLTKRLQDSGLSCSVFLKYDDTLVPGAQSNVAIYAPEDTLQLGMPFVKVKSFLEPHISSNTRNYIMAYLLRNLGFDIGLIVKHFQYSDLLGGFSLKAISEDSKVLSTLTMRKYNDFELDLPQNPETIFKSVTWRCGLVVTFLPRMIRRVLQRVKRGLHENGE